MYSIYEIAFFLLYYGGLAIASIATLLAIQGLVYQTTGFSIYKFINKKLDKILNDIEEGDKK